MIIRNTDLTAAEGNGGDASLGFRLAGVPTAPVTLRFLGDSQCRVGQDTLTFDSSNYDALQTLSIIAINDDVVEGTHSCTPTVALVSADVRFNGISVTLPTITISDDLVDQLRNRVSDILHDDLARTVEEQQRGFSTMSRNGLSRFKEGQDNSECGQIKELDVDGSAEASLAAGQTMGTFGEEYLNCQTGVRYILSGAFSVNWVKGTGTIGMLSMAQQYEKQTDQRLTGHFFGGYLSRNDVTGAGASGKINGVGLNGGFYGVRKLPQDLYFDYYIAGAVGHHRFDLTFADTSGDIFAEGNYSYLAGFAGAALSGEAKYKDVVIAPRIGIEAAYAKANDAKITASQLSITDTGRIEIADFNGVRSFLELAVSGERIGPMKGMIGWNTAWELAPRIFYSSGYALDEGSFGYGGSLAIRTRNNETGVTHSLRMDAETIDNSDRATLEYTRSRRFLNNAGTVGGAIGVSRNGAPQLSYGMELRF